ncbi:MAG: bifunctional 4-hydroxy-3-methylbut-2-enyl diphosphate reductase/30S ribosomal protein S1 [Defluviitaleaceae bacterium]|nr:bifunctional 4-hydroxy-3-methylbut-2-enyl diphosphate reductase/30S ribosomal protein S1 [Defluviitaleaceae bacterium]
MEIIAAKHMGFCAGVASAVNTAYEMAAVSKKNEPTGKNPQKYVTLGPIIHNSTVTDDLAQKGVKIIENVDDIENFGEISENTKNFEDFSGISETTETTEITVIIRAHGVPPAVEQTMQEKKINYIDRTCPHVKLIHKKVLECRRLQRTLIILGKKGHPEVQGILGYADKNNVIVVENAAELAKLLAEQNFFGEQKKFFLVVQTTYPQKEFYKAKKILEQKNFDLIAHNTICNATFKRQQEAERIAKMVDIMLILGDENSENTKNLYEISRQYCQKTILAKTIYTISKENLQSLLVCDRLGLTAGASTSPAVIKEAFLAMSEFEKNFEKNLETLEPNQPEDSTKRNVDGEENAETQSFEEMLDAAFMTLRTGDVVKGTVIQVTNSEITVNLGYKSDGIITKSEFTSDPNVELPNLVNLGDELEVLIVRVNDGDGNVLASKRRLEAQSNYKLLEQAFETKEPLPGRVQDLVKGGLIVNILGSRVFVPSSQISSRYIEDLSDYKGKELTFNILEFDRAKRRIIAGRRNIVIQENRVKKEELLAKIAVGDKLSGTVNRIADFGAFVDLGGADGLIHISELAWKRVRKVTEVLNVGDSVEVTVIDLNREKGKISLSLKDINSNPWNNIVERYPIGSLVEGKVVRTTTFGAFLNLEDGIDGLIHISQISNKHIDRPEDVLNINQIVTVKVTEVNAEARKISLSKKAADAELAGDYDEELEEQSEETPETATDNNQVDNNPAEE